MRVLLAALAVAAATVTVFSQAGSPADPSKLDRVDLLAAWADAVDRHQPGFADEGLRMVSTWSAGELNRVREHLPTVVSLIRDPDLAIFFRRVTGTGAVRVGADANARTRQVMYSGNELDRLRALARRHGVTRPADLCPKDDPARRPAFNSATQLLQRAATFHLDLAVVGAVGTPSTRRDNGSSFSITMDDGRALGEFGLAGHIELAREALDLVTEPCSIQPKPAAVPWVRDWYGASLAYQLSRGRFEVAHVLRAVELFRDDPDLLALGGAIHEALAAPQFQAALGSNRALRDRLQVLTASGELGRSEDLLRRALRLDGRLAEARIRLGHVLGLRGRHADAVRELERAVTDAGENRLLAYYARMLHGRALEASGARQPARVAYEQASRLFPSAHVPRLALSQLLRGSGDPATAGTMLERLVEPSTETPDDPWWSYHTAAGRSLDRRVRVVWAATPAAVVP
jgi:tetratricopeptide (TPR) repeat protein